MADVDPAQAAREAFLRHFGGEPAALYQAPGRVNLIGEHTDYNDGFVLPCAIDFHTVLAAAPRTDGAVHVVAADYSEQQDHFSLREPITPHRDYQWANYVRGTIRQLLEDGGPLQGMNLAVSGNVPQGAGLSSSAALEVVLASACNDIQRLGLTPTEIALIGQAAENRFVGTNCGIMDQLVSARGQAGHALLIDCRTLATEPVPIPADLAVIIIDSRVKRGLVDSEYNARRAQCEAASRRLGIRALRDISAAALQSRQAELDDLVARRARHVVTENERTLAAARALAAADLSALSELMAASHASMRDDFEITVPAIDHLVDIVQSLLGRNGGARMTGGGFGGCVVALAPREMTESIMTAVADEYPRRTGLRAMVHVCSPSAGASALQTPPPAAVPDPE